MTRDEFNRCAVCGRREGEPCCADCHRGHDYDWWGEEAWLWWINHPTGVTP